MRALKAAAAVHDALTDAAFALAVVALAAILGLTCFEVAARYAFAAPTRWAMEIVQALMVPVVFLGNLALETAADKASTDSVMDTTAAILDEIRQLRQEQTQQQQAQEEAANALHDRIHALEKLLEQKEKNNQ